MSYQFSNNESFVNPYTFVKGKNTVERSEKEQKAGTHTGVFTCLLYPKTPLLIPDACNKKEISGRGTEKVKHYSYPFFRLGKQPVIPGSSIRGPLRSVYEVLTDSCYSTARPEQYITARAKTPFLPGLLVNNQKKWELFSAKRYLLPIEEYGALPFPQRCTVKYSDVVQKYGNEVTFRGNERRIQNNNGQDISCFFVQSIYSQNEIPKLEHFSGRNTNSSGILKGYYCIGEYIHRKKYESIFVPKEQIELDSPKLKQAFEQLKEIKRAYQDEKVNQKFTSSRQAGDNDQHGGYIQVDLKKFEEANVGVLPIWYKETGGQYYFSLANIGRFRYEKSVDDILGKGDNGRMSCSSLKKLCKTCSLFGMVGEEEGLGSRVRITDAVFEGVIPGNIPSYNLTELRTPHPSYLPFYALTDNYSLGYDAPQCNIRGRKFYWHFMPDYTKLNGLPFDKIDAKMEGIGGNQESFQFKVYFENLTKEQMAELGVLLCLGENKKDGKLCFKLGHGKPLGFGSAKIVVKSLEERSFDSASEQPRYYIITHTLGEKLEDWDLFKKTETYKTELNRMQAAVAGIKNVLSLDNFSDLRTNTKVIYPYVVDARLNQGRRLRRNDLASSKWFSKNWQLGQDQPYRTLPVSNNAVNEQKLPVVELQDDQGQETGETADANTS